MEEGKNKSGVAAGGKKESQQATGRKRKRQKLSKSEFYRHLSFFLRVLFWCRSFFLDGNEEIVFLEGITKWSMTAVGGGREEFVKHKGGDGVKRPRRNEKGLLLWSTS